MRKIYVMGMVMALMLMGCEQSVTNDADQEAMQGEKEICFRCEGDFGNASFTRASLAADGKEMTDVWVMDYMGGQLVQQKHQSATDDDFGQPSLTLAYGQHHIYLVASRGEGPTLSTTDHKITWTKPLDTFYKDYVITVNGGTSAKQNVEMARAVTRLKLTVDDLVPADIATVTVTPGKWYYGLDYLTGEATEAKTNEPRVMSIPATMAGTTGELNVNVFGFSGATEWTTDIAVVAKNSTNDVIGSASIAGAPFKVNRVTNYNGNLFVNAGGFWLTLMGTWDTEYTGTW